MKRGVLFAALLSVFVSGAAFAAADPFCDTLNKVVAGARDKFAGLKGEAKKDEPEMWTATTAIRGSKECLIVGKASPSYMCSLYAGDEDESARDTYQDHVEWIGKCLGDEWKGKETADAERTEHEFVRGPGDPAIRVRSRIGEANAYSVEIWIDPAEKSAE